MSSNTYTKRSVDDPKNKATSLLTLPTSDLILKQASSNQHEKLILLELPKDISVDQFFANGARIMGAGSSDPARLVTESNGSFDMIKVETSNCLILVPPLDQHDSGGHVVGDNDELESDDVASSKRSKQSLVKMPSRKIGSHIIELQQTYLDRSALNEMLVKCVYDPFDERSVAELDNGNMGWTSTELVNELRVSDKEIIEALRERHAFRISTWKHDSIEHRYCLLSEESLKEAFDALLATFIEDDVDFKNCDIDRCIENATQRLRQGNSEETPMHDSDRVIKHCLQVVSEGSFHYDGFGKNTYISLDIGKIAIFLAHQLFNSTSEPWLLTSFVDEWSRLMPGVGDEFKPHLHLLKGIALQYENSNKKNGNEAKSKVEIFLKYLPERKLPMNIVKRFEILFQVKHQWTSEELESYIKPLINGTQITLSEVLLKHTRVIVSKDGQKLHQTRLSVKNSCSVADI